MMIDFALDAERNEGKPPREAIYQACLLRFRPILMTTMAALLGALPLMLGTGTGSELRHPLGITIVGGLIVSQVLTLFTTPVIYLWLRPARGAACRRAGARPVQPRSESGRAMNLFGTLHPPAGRDHAADLRACAGRRGGVLPAAGLAAAAGRFPDHLGAGDAAGRQPRGHGDHASPRRWSAISAQIADVTEMTSSSSVGSTRITLQFGLDRDIDGAARDVQAAINAARADLPTSLRSNPTYRKVNPADAPILILALTSDTHDARPDLRRGIDGAGAEAVAGRRHRPGRWSAAARCRRCASSSIPQALFKYGIGLEDVRAALVQRQRPQPEGRASRTAISTIRSTPTTRRARPTTTSR